MNSVLVTTLISLFLFLSVANATPSLDAVATPTNCNGASSCSFSHTVGAGCANALIIANSHVCCTSPNLNTTGITYNSVALIEQGGITGNEYRTEMWGKTAPSSGSAFSVAITVEATQDSIVGGALSLCGVHQTTPFGTFASGTAIDTTPTVNVTTTAGDLVVDSVGTSNAETLTVDASQTQNYKRDDTTQGVFGASSRETATGTTTTMSWAKSATNRWVIGAVPVKDAPAVTPSQQHTIIFGKLFDVRKLVKFLFPLPAFAAVLVDQEVIPRTTYAVGTYNIPSTAIALNTNHLVVTLDRDAMSSTSQHLKLDAEISFNNGTSWEYFFGVVTDGGVLPSKTVASVSRELPQPSNANRRIRGTAQVLGASITTKVKVRMEQL